MFASPALCHFSKVESSGCREGLKTTTELLSGDLFSKHETQDVQNKYGSQYGHLLTTNICATEFI